VAPPAAATAAETVILTPYVPPFVPAVAVNEYNVVAVALDVETLAEDINKLEFVIVVGVIDRFAVPKITVPDAGVNVRLAEEVIVGVVTFDTLMLDDPSLSTSVLATLAVPYPTVAENTPLEIDTTKGPAPIPLKF
jgi:hypothetical protein